LFTQDTILFYEVFHYLPLAAMNPTSQNGYDKLKQHASSV